MIKNQKLTANVTDTDLAMLDALVAEHAPFACRHAVHLAALRIGLEAMGHEPALLAAAVAAERARRRGVAA